MSSAYRNTTVSSAALGGVLGIAGPRPPTFSGLGNRTQQGRKKVTAEEEEKEVTKKLRRQAPRRLTPPAPARPPPPPAAAPPGTPPGLPPRSSLPTSPPSSPQSQWSFGSQGSSSWGRRSTLQAAQGEWSQTLQPGTHVHVGRRASPSRLHAVQVWVPLRPAHLQTWPRGALAVSALRKVGACRVPADQRPPSLLHAPARHCTCRLGGIDVIEQLALLHIRLPVASKMLQEGLQACSVRRVVQLLG